MTTEEKLKKVENENLILTQNVQQLQESLNQSQANFEFLKNQNEQLISSNNALTQQLSNLTAEIGKLKSQIQSNTPPIQANSQPIAASSPSPAKATKRHSLQETDENIKKLKDSSWFEASSGSILQGNGDALPMELHNNQTESQPNLTNVNDKANSIEKSNELNDSINSSGFRTVSYKKSKNQTNNAPKSNANAVKSEKPAPIQVNLRKDGYLALHEALNRSLGSGKFVANNMIANQAVRIQPIDMENSVLITKFLLDHGYEFHTFKSKSERGKCYILRGLNEVQNINHIHAALVQAGFPAETTVTQHITGFQKAHPEIKHNILFRVVTPNTFDEKIINEIDALFDLKVKFEKMKGSKVIQCKRCQEYFHSASSCHHPFRCVKCKESHEIGQCPRDANPDLPIRCVNCDGAHSANNYKECKFFNEKIAPILNKKRGQITPNKIQRPKMISSNAPNTPHVNTGTSYAKAVKNSTTSKSTNQPKNNVSVKPGLSLDEKFDKFLEAQFQFQNQMVQMFGNLNRAMAPRGPQQYSKT